MIYQKHILPELFDIGSVFYNMAGGSYNYYQYENGQAVDKEPAVKYQKWEQIDDRFDSLFGSTYFVPLEKYLTYPDKIKIAIVGDHWLSNESTITDMRMLDRWDMTYIHHCNYGNDLEYTLVDELKIMFPNATFDIIGDFSHSSSDMNTLRNVYDYLTEVEDYPDYLIFNGFEGSWIETGGDIDTCATLMVYICGFCARNNIKACMVYTLVPEVFDVSDSILNYLSLQIQFPYRGERYSGRPLEIEYCLLNEWLNIHLYIPEDYVKYGNNTDRLEQYKLPVVDNQGIHKEMIEWYIITTGARKYKEVIYNNIKNFIYENLFKDYNLKRSGFYISLTHKDVTENTYGYYHGDKAKVYAYDYYPEQMITDIPIFGHPKYVFRSKYFTRNNPWNLFSNTGEFIAIALHTEFNHKCWLSEQKGSTCEDEGSKRRQDTRGVTNELANLMFVLREREGAETRLRPPIMQGTGTSWLTISDGNKERYKNQLGYQCPIEVYISRDDYNFTITTRIHSEEGYQDIYQSVAAGKMTQSLDPLPLYVVGGTTGLKNDVYSYIPVAGVRTEIHGCVYDLDMDNVALSNTTANHPTKFYDCIFSNFKVYNSNAGEKWRSVFLHSQSATVQQNYNCAPPDDHAIWLNEPTYYMGRQDANSFPPSSDNRNRIGNKWLTKHGFEYMKGQEPMNVEPQWYDSPLQSFRAFTKTSWYDDKPTYCSGNITSILSSWDWRTPCGEINYPSEQISHTSFRRDVVNWRYREDVDKSDVQLWEAHHKYAIGDLVLANLWEEYPNDDLSKFDMWESDTVYGEGSVVIVDGTAYICLTYHKSSSISFEDDKLGVFEFTGVKYLVIPCGWEERLYWYDSHYVWTTAWATKLNNTWNNDSVLEEYEKNKLEFNRRQIKDKLFVLLEQNGTTVVPESGGEVEPTKVRKLYLMRVEMMVRIGQRATINDIPVTVFTQYGTPTAAMASNYTKFQEAYNLFGGAIPSSGDERTIFGVNWTWNDASEVRSKFANFCGSGLSWSIPWMYLQGPSWNNVVDMTSFVPLLDWVNPEFLGDMLEDRTRSVFYPNTDGVKYVLHISYTPESYNTGKAGDVHSLYYDNHVFLRSYMSDRLTTRGADGAGKWTNLYELVCIQGWVGELSDDELEDVKTQIASYNTAIGRHNGHKKSKSDRTIVMSSDYYPAYDCLIKVRLYSPSENVYRASYSSWDDYFAE